MKTYNETKQYIKNVFEHLIKNVQIFDLIKKMPAQDVAQVISIKLDIHPKNAEQMTSDLIKHAHDVHYVRAQKERNG